MPEKQVPLVVDQRFGRCYDLFMHIQRRKGFLVNVQQGFMLDDDFPNVKQSRRKGRPRKLHIVHELPGGKKIRAEVKGKGQIRRKKQFADRYPVYIGNRTEDDYLERALWNMPTNNAITGR